MQSFFRTFPRSNVLNLRKEEKGLALVAINERNTQEHEDGMPILRQISLFHLVRANLTAHHLSYIVKISTQISGMSDLLEISLEQFLLGIANDFAKRGIHAEPGAI